MFFLKTVKIAPIKHVHMYMFYAVCKDDDFSLSTHSLRSVVYIRKGVIYGIVKKSVKIRKLFLYAFFTGSLGIRKFEISCCA